jgi:hypothetical protein
LCKAGAEKIVCGTKCERVGNLSGFAGKARNWARFFWIKAIAGDESWVFDYDPETKRQRAEWYTKSSSRPKKARMSRSRVKTMIIVFFDSCGHCAQRICTFRTVNHAFYKDVLERLRKQIQRVRTDIADDWVLHHDNAPAHTALSI